MQEKILFMIFNNEIKFLNNSDMDHREWFLSLGGNMEDYEQTIRGFIMEGKLIYFKADLKYDNEVIDIAIKTANLIRKQVKNENLKVCCGINPGHDGEKWEAILTLKEEDLDGYVPPVDEEEEKRKQEQKQKQAEMLKQIEPTEPIIEFENNFEDPEFIEYATKFTGVLLVVALVAKLIYISKKMLFLSDRGTVLLIVAQMAFFALTIVGYNKKMPQAKYFALGASASSVLMFNLIDIVIAILNFIFTVNQNSIKTMIAFLKKWSEKGLAEAKKIKEKNLPSTKENTPVKETSETSKPHPISNVQTIEEYNQNAQKSVSIPEEKTKE